ncbi:hypothetical protein E3A20_29260 [Planctomyces bekefii]|uniref:Uncharacterized protein n=1 Tax=Planctomyces bekefii TaxID=1653850 RepID=A0A5C6LZL3_9PLAN|nr:hypothetical protein E3A20_29260 [Planctomyces bekefii]
MVTNSDPFVEREATIHLTNQSGVDSQGALAALGVVQDGSRYQFEEIFSRRGWMPQDPAVQGQGIPGWALYRAGDVPSGVYLGAVPPATTYVFKVSSRTSMTAR